MRLTRRSLTAGLAALPLPARASVEFGMPPLRGRDGWLFLGWEHPARMEPTASENRVTGLLNQAGELLRAAGMVTGFVLIPAKTRVFADMLPDAPFGPAAEGRYRAALEGLRRGFQVVPDLAGLFAAQRRAGGGEELFFRLDTHWRPAAAALAAAETARMLSPLLPGRPGNGMRLGPAVREQRQRRDLGDLLPAAERAALPVESYMIRRPAPARAAGLLDEARPEVAMFGSSFMAPEFNFHAELSAALDRPVSLHWRVQTRGLFRTLLDYLEGPEFRRQRPRAILLSHPENAMGLNPESRGAYPETAMPGAAFLDGIRRALAT